MLWSDTIGSVLSFLQESLTRRLSPSTFKVYVAGIAAHHDAVDSTSLTGICRAAGGATPNIFVSFYNLQIYCLGVSLALSA